MNRNQPPKSADPLLRRSQAAAYLGLPVTLLEHLARRGEGPRSICPGRRTRYYCRHDLDAWFATLRNELPKSVK